jgi:hypothetical protein
MDKAISLKLLAFQKKVEAITKDLENPYFKSQYFDVNKVIQNIKPVLNDVGLVVLQPMTMVGDKQAIKTVILDSDTGAEYSETTTIPETVKAQDTGSAITYFRRYCLTSLLLLQGETDDDGNVASDAKPKYPKYIPKQKLTPEEKEKFGPRKAVSTVTDEEEIPFS